MRSRCLPLAFVVLFVSAIYGAPATRAQTYFSLCAGSPNEKTSQCQALKAADKRVKEAEGKVPGAGNSINATASDRSVGTVCSGQSGYTSQSTAVPAECEGWRSAVAERAKALAAVQMLVSGGTGGQASPPPAAPTAAGALPVIQVASGEQVALVGKPMRIEGMVGNDVGAPKLKINGQSTTLFEPRSGSEPVAKHSYAFRIDVPTQQPGTQIYLLEACDSAGACIGKEVVVRVTASDGPSVKGRNYALVIGNNDYKTLPALKTAVGDAKAVAELLKARYTFDDGTVTLLLNADRSTILGALTQLRGKLTPDDRLLVYYAGHGQIDEAANEGFWQPVDALPGADYTWISNADLRRNLRGMSAKHVLVVADSCFSGSLTRSAPQQMPNSDRFFAQIDGHFSRKVITSGGNEPVADSGTGNHSVFAYYFLKALKENNAPYITSFELFNTLARAVANNSSQKPEHGTIGNAGDEGAGDFTFILKNRG